MSIWRPPWLKAAGPAFSGVSRAVCHWLEHFGIHPAGQLYNAVEPSEVRALAHAPDAVDWRARLGLPAEEKLVVFLGRVIPEKGVAELVDAFSSAGLSGCSLVVAGDGRCFPGCRENCPPGRASGRGSALCPGHAAAGQAQLYCLPHLLRRGISHHLSGSGCLWMPHSDHPHRRKR